MLTNIDVLDVCAVMLQRCGLGAEHLAAHMARPEPPRAAPLAEPATTKPAPAAEPPQQATGVLTPLQARILEMCQDEGGATQSEMMGATGMGLPEIGHRVQGLIDLGMVTRVKLAGIRAARLFANPEHAAAWVQRQQGKPAPVVRAKVGKPGAELVVRSGTASPAAADKPVLRGEVVIPDGVRITVAPTPAPRYGVAADAVLTGGFSTSRPGINPLTGEAW